MDVPAPLPWASAPSPAPKAAAPEQTLSVGAKIEVLWQLGDDGGNEEEAAAAGAATATAAPEEEQGTAEAAATTPAATAATEAADASAKKEPQVVWWSATVESLQGESGAPLRATLRYEAKPELGFDAETATVEFVPPSSPSSVPDGAPQRRRRKRELRNVGEDGTLSEDEVPLRWRFLGEADDEEVEEEGEEGEEGEEDEGEMEEEGADAFATAAEISASDLEKTLSAQLSSLERATGLRAEAAGAAALLAGAGGSSQRAAEVALKFEAFGEVLKERLAAAARANGGAALGAEEVRQAVAEARRSGGGGV